MLVRWCLFFVSDYWLLSDTDSTVEEFSIWWWVRWNWKDGWSYCI